MPASSVVPRRKSGFLSSLGHTRKTTPRPQTPLQGQKILCATPKTSSTPFDNTRDLNLYKEFLAVDNDDDDLETEFYEGPIFLCGCNAVILVYR